MGSIIRCTVCLSSFTFLPPHDSAAGSLGRVRVTPREGCCFRLVVQNSFSDPKCLFVRVDAYRYDVSHVWNRVVKHVAFFTAWASRSTVRSFLFGAVCGFTTEHLSLLPGMMMYDVNTGHICMHALPLLLLCYVVAAEQLLLLVIVCRWQY